MTLAARYGAKISANVLAMIAGVLSVSLTLRALGPEAYGRYEYLSTVFQRVAAFLDVGTSTSFFTHLSQRPGDVGLVSFYLRFLAAGSMLLLAGAAVVHFFAGTVLWAGESLALVLLAALYGCMTWWHQVARKATDAHALTVRAEWQGVAIKVASTVALAALFFGGWLSIGAYFALQVASLALSAVVWLAMARSAQHSTPALPVRNRADYMREMWSYSHPLFLYSLIGVGVAVLERWWLQIESGSVQQGFFGFASQVGIVCFVFTGAMTQLLTREFAVAWDSSDRTRMASLFSRTIPAFYCMAAYLCVFVAYRAEDVASIFGGASYVPGATVIAVMALYPMHQTYGQLSGAVFYATGQTALYRNIGIAGMIAGLALMFWLIAPQGTGGLGLGALGLAFKFVLLQFVLVNVQLWFNTRLLSLRFVWFLAHQLVVPTVLLVCALIASIAIGAVVRHALWNFLLSGALYSVLAAILFLGFPTLLGLTREELFGQLRRLRRRIGIDSAADMPGRQ